MSSAPSDPVLIHFYRAVVTHMDVWRERMDATTNWAAATGAGMITFTFSTPAAPHYVLLLALFFQLVFLLMESRRYQTFDLWRRRFRVLNRAMIVPALDPGLADASGRAELTALARDMGRTVPHLSLLHAMGFRVRRNYGYLFAVTLLAWLLKLELEPHATNALEVLLDRASVAVIPGSVVAAFVAVSALAMIALATTAPTSDIVDWKESPQTWERWLSRGRNEVE